MGHSLKFAQSCKSGACSKLSKALIEIDVAKERLANAVSFMWESKAAAEAGKGNGTNEVVMDNSHDGKNSATVRVILQKEVGFMTTSTYHDQRGVPSIQTLKNDSNERKR
ncbi:hypothetical protein Sjap_005965 [Stephania japonica]|uniref:Uncharacterized protein n=1 Tax=Stephania japonica TaxID=461633 RepID=A0AAP0PJA8_9MAGN